MPQPRTVILEYDPTDPSVPFGPAQRKVPVAPDDTIRFQLGPKTRAAKPNCKLRITIHQAQHFSPGVLQHSPGQDGSEELVTRVVAGSAAELAAAAASNGNVISGYKCELLDENNVPIPGLSSDGKIGGDIVPDSGVA